ncbi:FAD-binding oxidoreductase [Xenorhabdus sp. 42]|uniref:NAD(P)/FAD-dependent oxidoreductase n=1 Tax=Xenorhabdus szentirmaii TaxID=290112 RepID=UPI0019C89079|nr:MULTISPECIES: FAD-dependent oxidoreductase [unclassified Xenorhabdus]MBD2794162.1 FAD-binding oxidoreductase [Xenorhabdus sp. CUL]MBD2822852.1 FAD-binding oxidoreductase [Xenorhabdus sp. 42]MBD2823410.1 FAD-binding oxidoreductase [Xenorhabdus sp. 5]
MSMNRRDFITSTAALSGVSLLTSLLPTKLLADVPGISAAAIKPELLSDARMVPTRLGIDSRIWNWHKNAAHSGPMPMNWYEATLTEWPSFGKLPGDQTCDVVVIGGGLLGVSAALHLAESGRDVVLIEKDNIGSGASGRNGGQITPGLARWEAETMADNLSPDEANRLWRFASVEAMELVDELAARYDFTCDRKRGHITAAVHPGHMGVLVKNADARRQLGDSALRIIGSHELQEMVKSDIYHGATIDSIGGQVHPLALLRGMAYGFCQSGGRIYDGTAVKTIQDTPQGTVVVTDFGTVKAREAVVLAVHYATEEFLSNGNTTVPFYTYVAVTPPLPVHELLPADLPVYDTQLQIDYYRAVRGNRLLFGGQGTGNSWSPRDVNNYLLERIRTVFPQLHNPELEYSWSGISDITLNGAIDARKSDGQIPRYLVHGWSGHGVAQTVRIGKAISDDITGRNDDFTMLTRIEHDEIPLGKYLGPVAIPLVKGALSLKSLFNPAEVVSF